MRDPVRERIPADRLAPLLLLVPALWMVHGGLFTGRYIGLAWGEQWGRLFVTGQVRRWFSGTPIGWADLVDAPQGRPFWPVDPVLQALAIPLDAIFGEPTGWALLIAILSATAGWGGYAAARSLGAPVLGAIVAGLMLQLNPFWLRNAADGVTEVLALGPPAFAVAAAIPIVRGQRSRGGWLAFAGAIGLVCGTSPYYAVYGAIALAVSLPLWPRDRLGTAARLLALIGAIGVLFAVPLLLTESGAGGRMSDAWSGGYRLLPEPLVTLRPDGAIARLSAPKPVPGGELGRAGQSVLRQVLVQWPGGVAVTVTLLAGLFARGAPRRIAALASAWLLFGPLWALFGRYLGDPSALAPLQRLLLLLPGTSLLGNANRLVVVPVIAAALVAGLLFARLGAARANGAAAAIVLLVIGAAVLEVPPLTLPAVDAERPRELLAAIDGPTATFPSGDPPLWNPGPRPKEGLWLARHHGGPQAFDYGRGGIPLDAPLLVRLSQVGAVPLGARAAETMRPASDEAMWTELRQAGFRHVLVLRRELTDRQYEAVYGWLTAQLGPPRAQGEHGGVWAL